MHMTSRERVLAAIQHQKIDQAPMDFGGTMMSLCLPEFLQDMRNTLGFKLPEDRDIDGTYVDEQIQRYLNVDMRAVHNTIPQAVLKEIDYDLYQKREAHRHYIRMSERDVITYQVVRDFPLRDMTYEEVRDNFVIEPVKPYPDKHIDWYIETAKKYRADGFATSFWVTVGFFEVTCKLRGYDQTCIDMLAEPGIAHLLNERIMKVRLKEVEQIVSIMAPYIDIFCFGDDLAMQTGPFMSPSVYRRMIQPYQQQVYQRTRELAPNSFIFHHSCGSMYRLLPNLVEMGVSILNPTQVSAFEMSPEQLSGYKDICYHGGIDLQEVLPHYKPHEVTAETERVLRILAPGGGYLCAPCHCLPEDVPVENILAMFKADRSLPASL
jgi:uroporphyrinogen decarboxylase